MLFLRNSFINISESHPASLPRHVPRMYYLFHNVFHVRIMYSTTCSTYALFIPQRVPPTHYLFHNVFHLRIIYSTTCSAYALFIPQRVPPTHYLFQSLFCLCIALLARGLIDKLEVLKYHSDHLFTYLIEYFWSM